MTPYIVTVVALFVGVDLLIWASQGAAAASWTLLGAGLLILSGVVVEALRKRD